MLATGTFKSTSLADGWEFTGYGWGDGQHRIGWSKTEWLEAIVPGAVHLDLMRHGVIPHPHERMNEMGVQWVDEQDWSYRCRFQWTPDPYRPKRALRFAGLDTVARIFLNGELIGEWDNMFLPVEIDVSELLRAGENEIRIDFASATRVGTERREEYLQKEGIPEHASRFGPRSFVRKMQCSWGWDWGPALASCGIWQPVELLEYRSRLRDFTSRTKWHDDGSMTVTVETQIDGPGEIEYALWRSDGSDVEPEDEDSQWEGNSLTLKNVQRWFPHRINGDEVPVAYQMAVTVRDGDEILDYSVKTVGFSENILIREKDEVGESFEFEINGERIWIRGANWIPDYSFPGAITKARLRERLEQARDLGCNMLRVWGGGLYESEDFYDLCDELGILVWQDFPFACGYYPDTQEWPAIIEAEARYQVRRIRHHPCLALWCGNNENLQMWQQAWDGGPEALPPRFYGENLYNDVLARVVAEEDPAHCYIPSSPCGESEPDCNGGKIGDSHYWDVWHGRGDWKYYADSDTRFSSEYGFASSCGLATWAETIDPVLDWSPTSPVVRWHDKTLKGYETFMGYVHLHYPQCRTLEDWVYYSQLNQRDAMRFGVEHFRRFEPCRGSLIWQLNDIWPTQSWALIDSAGRLKAAAYELKRLYSDRALSLVRKGATMELWTINDGVSAWQGWLRFEAYDLQSGRLLREVAGLLEEEPDSRRRALMMDLQGLNTAETIVVAYSALSEHEPEPESILDGFTYRLLVDPKEARFAPAGEILASNHEEGVLTFQLDAPTVDLCFTVDGDTSPFLENYCSFSQAGRHRVRVDRPISHFEARSLAGEHKVRITRSPL